MRVTGSVKWFDPIQGFGVIERAPGQAACFVQHSAIRGTVYHPLAVGDPVEFDLLPNEESAIAQDVVRLDHSFVPAAFSGDATDREQ